MTHTKIFLEMKSIKDKVTFLLNCSKELKDSDPKLIATFYFMELGRIDIDALPTREFLKLLANNQLPFPDSITRVRRKIQEQCPELRGKNYTSKQDNSQLVKKEIHNL